MPAASQGTHQSGIGQHEYRACRGKRVRGRPQDGEELAVDWVAVVERRYPTVRGEDRAQPVPHPFDGRGYLVGRGLTGGPHEIHYVDEVSKHLAVIGRRTL